MIVGGKLVDFSIRKEAAEPRRSSGRRGDSTQAGNHGRERRRARVVAEPSRRDKRRAELRSGMAGHGEIPVWWRDLIPADHTSNARGKASGSPSA
jgi:hypothetical protein